MACLALCTHARPHTAHEWAAAAATFQSVDLSLHQPLHAPCPSLVDPPSHSDQLPSLYRHALERSAKGCGRPALLLWHSMAPIPPVLVRILAGFMTQALTRRLQQSPAFFRLVDRLVHEADHLPHRLQGKPVPPYVGRDPHEPTLGEQAEEAWRRQGGWQMETYTARRAADR